MNKINSVEELEAIYGKPAIASLAKVSTEMTPAYRKWVKASRFCVLTTVGPEGTDGTPRGDSDPVVREVNPKTLLMPDWRGNNRMDSLRNIVRDGRVSLMFMIAGSSTVVRVNGTAIVTADPDVLQSFAQNKKAPRSVIEITIGEIYFQCARAIMRSEIWGASGEEPAGLPTAGDFLSEMSSGKEGGAPYDKSWPERAKNSMW